jgi:hypothetical protein
MIRFKKLNGARSGSTSWHKLSVLQKNAVFL